MRTTREELAMDRGIRVKKAILLASELKNPGTSHEDWRQRIMKKVKYTMEGMKNIMVSKLNTSDGRLYVLSLLIASQVR